MIVVFVSWPLTSCHDILEKFKDTSIPILLDSALSVREYIALII